MNNSRLTVTDIDGQVVNGVRQLEVPFGVLSSKAGGTALIDCLPRHPQSFLDVDAENNTIYFSLTLNKLVYKTSAGVVHALY